MMRRGPGLVGMAARTAVVAGTATAVSGRVARRQQQKYSGQEAQQQAVVPEQVPAEDDKMAQIEKLAQLHASGTLTDEEFAAAKAKVLGI